VLLVFSETSAVLKVRLSACNRLHPACNPMRAGLQPHAPHAPHAPQPATLRGGPLRTQALLSAVYNQPRALSELASAGFHTVLHTVLLFSLYGGADIP
tara:strand:+ start:1447 stop:1740 length:294 start_codon:yes stop_codon:yes gene_type:complete